MSYDIRSVMPVKTGIQVGPGGNETNNGFRPAPE